MLDPISLSGLAVITGGIARRNTCPVCNEVRLFTKWQAWTCCNVSQCRDCAAATEQAKNCRNCGHKVK